MCFALLVLSKLSPEDTVLSDLLVVTEEAKQEQPHKGSINAGKDILQNLKIKYFYDLHFFNVSTNIKVI